VLFFSLTYVFTWSFWIWLIPNPSLSVLHLLGSLGPAVAALTVSHFADRDRFRGLTASIGRWRVPLKWYALTVGAPLVLLSLSLLISGVITGSWPDRHVFLRAPEFPSLGLWYSAASVLFFGFGEEIGWRGYATPKIEETGRDARQAALILSILWAIWHWPLFFYAKSGLYHMNPFMILGWLVFIILGAQLLTWVYKNSGQSVFIVGLFHGVLDIVLLASQLTPLAIGAINAAIILAGLAVARLYGPTLLVPVRKASSIGTRAGSREKPAAAP
jgi:membrane protease YdiL (CAAX protease family)